MHPIFVLVFTCFLLQIVDFSYHYDRARSLRMVGSIASIKDAHLRFKKIGLGAKPYDDVIGILPFLWTWLYIISATMLAIQFQNIGITILSSFFIATRMRALQEIGHFAMHGTLVINKNLGLVITDVFCQYPLLLIASSKRHISHCVQHHPNAGIEAKDPNIDEFITIGFKPMTSPLETGQL